MDWVYALAIGYLLGSIPFGLILTRAFGAGDIRTIGSGNIGATNVLRTGRKGLAMATLLLDAGKGFVAIVLVSSFVEPCRLAKDLACSINNQLYSVLSNSVLDSLEHGPIALYVPLAILGVMLGHCFPVWLKFRGGKGVATLLGVGFGLDWRIGIVAIVIWIVAASWSKFSSIGGMASAVAVPVAASFLTWARSEIWATYDGLDVMVWALLYIPSLLTVALLVIFQHRANIARLSTGTEPKIGQKA